MPRKLLVALHDVTPAHAGRIARAERLFASLGIPRVTYLLVPDFHASAPAHESRDFVEWCRSPRAFDVRWFLHGYFHSDSIHVTSAAGRLSFAEWFGKAFLTAGEGEFLTLRGHRLRARLEAGVQSFARCLGEQPAGFVAPAWLFNEELMPALARLGVLFTESHFHVFHVQMQQALKSPVITWATRTRIRRHGSLIASALERRLWARRPVVRVALHPADFDDDRIVASIACTLEVLRRDREVTTYDRIGWRDLSPASGRGD
jgi:uncharacterized protein